MPATARRRLTTAVAAAGVAAVVVVMVAARSGPLTRLDPTVAGLLSGFAGLLAAIGAVLVVASRRFCRRRREPPTANGPARTEAALPFRIPGAYGAEVGRLARYAGAIVRSRHRGAYDAEARLRAIVAAATEGIVVVTDTGLISLANTSARRVLGADRIGVGRSIYGLFDRDCLVAAARAARSAGGPVAVDLLGLGGRERVPARVVALPDQAGLVLFLMAAEAEARPALHRGSGLHDRPPDLPAASAATPIDALPALSLDLETTGLDPATDRIVAVATVRLQGLRIYRHIVFDSLVDPCIPVPRRATRIHGLTTAMVAGAPSFAETWPMLRSLLHSGVVVIGHNIGFDLTMLAREASRIGETWHDPPSLDTALLAAALEPQATALELDDVAARLGVSVVGRHTALGDALAAAEVFTRMIPRLREQGIRTAGEASAFAARGHRLRRLQQAAGWRPTGIR